MRDPQQELEHLRALATANPTKRFSKLLKIVRHETFLAQAWERVRTNVGSRTPGVDGKTKRTIDPNLVHHLAHDLKLHQYTPQPVRRVYIPKGRNQRRGLGGTCQ
jgi:retron-type reverse transcriptase